MKGTCALVASVLAVSTVALSSSNEGSNCPMGKQGAPSNACGGASSDKEKFASRFDGLRFIETLVTAHR